MLITFFLFSGLFSIRAEETLSADYKYYPLKLEEVQNTIRSITNDASWRKWVRVTEAEKGINIAWKAAVKNVRVASPLLLSLSGTHAVFSDLKAGSGGCQIGFTFSTRAAYGDYITDPKNNPLASLPLVFALNTQSGTVTCFAAKALNLENNHVISKQVYQSDQLKTEALSGKEFSLEFKIISGDTPETNIWQVMLAGEKFTLPQSDMIDVSSSFDPTVCYMTVNAWNAGGSNTMSINWQSLHGGALTCSDKPESKPLLDGADALIKRIAAIKSVEPSTGKEIQIIRATYDAMPENQKFFIKNYAAFVQMENAYGVVEQIASIKSVTGDSGEILGDIDTAYAALTDDEKRLVTNYSTFCAWKKRYLQILTKQLFEKEFFTVSTVSGSPEIIRKNETVLETVDRTVDVDGGTKVKTVTNHVNVSGKNGMQYLWIPITAAAVLLSGMATWFLIVFIKRKKARELNEYH